MKVRFKSKCEIECVDSFDEALDDAETSTEVFDVGDEVEFDVLDHPQKFQHGDFVDDTNFLNVQFGNGSVAFGLSKEWFDIIEGDVAPDHIATLTQLCGNLGLEAEDLDDLVHDVFSHQASTVNNSGVEAQLECLLENSEYTALCTELKQLAQNKQ